MSPDHNPRSDTSRDAAVFNMPRKWRDRDRVLDALIAAGEKGRTDFETASFLSIFGPKIGQTSAGKRRLDLVREGLVARRLVLNPDTWELVPDKRPSPTGASAAVWCLAHYSEPRPM